MGKPIKLVVTVDSDELRSKSPETDSVFLLAQKIKELSNDEVKMVLNSLPMNRIILIAQKVHGLMYSHLKGVK